MRKSYLSLMLLLLCGNCLGCATPQYLFPTGYSSTYQKAMINAPDDILIRERVRPERERTRQRH